MIEGGDNAIQTWLTNTFSGMINYFRGVRSEWGKINWPERRQVIAETIFVIVIVFVFTVSIYLMDLIFKGLLGFLK